MKLTNEQIAGELQALQTAVEEVARHVQTHFPASHRRLSLHLLQFIAGVLRSTKRECGFGTWQELDEEQIVGELQTLRTATEHVLDIVTKEQAIGELQQALQTGAEHDAALQAAIASEIAALHTAREQHFHELRQAVRTLRLVQVSVATPRWP